jgi:hypothetical protein
MNTLLAADSNDKDAILAQLIAEFKFECEKRDCDTKLQVQEWMETNKTNFNNSSVQLAKLQIKSLLLHSEKPLEKVRSQTTAKFVSEMTKFLVDIEVPTLDNIKNLRDVVDARLFELNLFWRRMPCVQDQKYNGDYAKEINPLIADHFKPLFVVKVVDLVAVFAQIDMVQAYLLLLSKYPNHKHEDMRLRCMNSSKAYCPLRQVQLEQYVFKNTSVQLLKSVFVENIITNVESQSSF